MLTPLHTWETKYLHLDNDVALTLKGEGPEDEEGSGAGETQKTGE